MWGRNRGEMKIISTDQWKEYKKLKNVFDIEVQKIREGYYLALRREKDCYAERIYNYTFSSNKISKSEERTVMGLNKTIESQREKITKLYSDIDKLQGIKKRK